MNWSGYRQLLLPEASDLSPNRQYKVILKAKQLIPKIPQKNQFAARQKEKMQQQINQFRECKRKQKLFRITSDAPGFGTCTFVPITNNRLSPVQQLRNKILYENDCSTREA